MSRWRRVLGRELGPGAGLLAWFLGFESGRAWQIIGDLGQLVDAWVRLELVAALHCVLGRK